MNDWKSPASNESTVNNPVIYSGGSTRALMRPGPGSQPDLEVQPIPLDNLDGEALVAISVDGGLALDETEMRAIQDHYRSAGRVPTRMELERREPIQASDWLRLARPLPISPAS